MPLPPPGTIQSDTILDSPPPSPAVEYGMSPGPSPDPTKGLGGLVPGAPSGVNSGQLPPDMLTGMMKTAEQMSGDLDAFAQMAPDLSADCLAVKDALTRLMAKVLMAGAGPTSPTNPGMNFPGGGIDSGGLPLAPSTPGA